MVYAFDPFPGEDTPNGDFGVAVHPLSLHVGPLGEGSVLVRTWAGLAAQPLLLTVTGLPAAVSAEFDPHQVDAGGDSKLVVSVAGSARARTHAVTVVATSPNGKVARAYLSLTIR